MNHNHSHHDHHNMMMQDFKKRFIVSLFLTIPVLFLSPLVQDFLGYSVRFASDKYVLFALSLIVFFYGGLPFLNGFWREMKKKSPGMMTLIAVAISTAFVYSSFVVFGLAGRFFFWELVTLIDIMLLGHWIEMRSTTGASKALEGLSALIPDNAHLLKGGAAVDIGTHELKNGDIILVKPGEKIPADGIVRNGESFVNESLLTGEFRSVSKSKDSKVIGGSVNEDGSLEIEVRGVGSDSYLSKVINLVRQAQESKSKTQATADKAAFWLTIAAVSAGLITFIAWIFINSDIAFAVERTATVLVIACPHALGLAIPLVVAISTTMSAQKGFLIRNRTAFENARKISTVVFDKTGTLTKGAFEVRGIFPLDADYSENEVIKLFAGLDKASGHPIAKAIVKEAEKRSLPLSAVNGFKAVRGKGVEGVIEGKKTIIASPGYVKELGLEIPDNFRRMEGTTVFLIVSDILAGAANLTDVIRDGSSEAVNALKREGIKIWMLTGDNEASAKSVSDVLGLDGYFSGVLPEQKQDKIKWLQDKGEFVAMVGDGINDAPALAQSDVGIAIGSGTDIAAETADIILVNSNPKDVSSVIAFGRATYRKMIQNLVWAAGYNIFAIPLAAGVLSGFGIILSPAVGAVLMSLSTVIVAVNARTLRP